MNTNRTKGHNFERAIRKSLLSVFPECQTSRYGSREEDDNAIDFINTGNLAIQAKNYKVKPNFNEELKKMNTDKIKVLAFKHNKIRGKSGEYAVLRWEDFIKIINDIGEVF